MPRHLISDAHEWINEIPTVPSTIHETTPRNGLGVIGGERRPVELDSSPTL
ncbi:hypothetical protein Syun_006770 [Stephania yunnanensis]|uniref:Uncharacterized protein n=1 Tax=Stephania yunnanensis TaxID=152371 RepID=A0AAP0KYX5_9MAGN